MEHRWRVSAKHTCHACCGSERPRRSRGVKYPVMRAAEKCADPNTRLIAHDCSDHHIAPRCPCMLRCREDGGEHDGCRMEDRSIVDIILLHHMRGGPVYQGSEQRRGAPARGQDFARAIAWTHRGGELLQDADRLRVAAREG